MHIGRNKSNNPVVYVDPLGARDVPYVRDLPNPKGWIKITEFFNGLDIGSFWYRTYMGFYNSRNIGGGVACGGAGGDDDTYNDRHSGGSYKTESYEGRENIVKNDEIRPEFVQSVLAMANDTHYGLRYSPGGGDPPREGTLVFNMEGKNPQRVKYKGKDRTRDAIYYNVSVSYIKNGVEEALPELDFKIATHYDRSKIGLNALPKACYDIVIEMYKGDESFLIDTEPRKHGGGAIWGHKGNLVSYFGGCWTFTRKITYDTEGDVFFNATQQTINSLIDAYNCYNLLSIELFTNR